eukprot:scaffold1451_cov267-Pinguiococcus_pyrenoidosus.AAC.2
MDVSNSAPPAPACDSPCVCLPPERVALLEKVERVEAVPVELGRQAVAEFLGTMLLVATVVGSGIQADQLSRDNAGVALLGNAVATWGILYAGITVFGPISSAHFNPIVSLAVFLKDGSRTLKQLLTFWSAQVFGGVAGTMLAHSMFELDAVAFGGKVRTSAGEAIGEIVATFGLLLVVFGSGAKAPMAVGLYIVAGYFFTSSTSFANPAVTIARAFTNTFASIAWESVPVFLAAQVAGLLIAMPVVEYVLEGRPLAEAAAVLLRK